jgi:dsDNA-binding SOS-regulon protein
VARPRDARGPDEMDHAARRMADAADRMADVVEQLRGVVSGSGPFTEEEADRIALAAVHRARKEAESERAVEAAPPSPEDVERWVTYREDLRMSEGREVF